MSNLFRLSLLCGSVLMGILLAGCSRPEGESAKISMTLPSPQSLASKTFGSVSAQSNDDGYHLIINVTGDGNSIFCSYDSKRSTTVGPCRFNDLNVSLDVPTGKRLFQVMYAVDSSSGTSFNYGEKSADLNSSSVTVNMALSALTGNGKMGHVHGRYLDGSSSTPIGKTGTLLVRYKPSSGSPAMTLVQQEMFSGWFQTFAFGAIPLSYEVNGVSLFGNAMSLESFDALTTPGDDVLVYNESATFEWILGWFGPGTNVSATTSTTSSPCISSEYNTCLVNGSTARTKFLGPLRSANGSFISWASTDMVLKYMPGTNADLDGLKMIVIPNVTDPNALKPYFIDEGLWDCEALAKAYPSGIQTSSAPTPSVAYYSTFTSPALAASDVAVICPYKGTKLYQSAVLYPESFNSYGHGGYQGPYVHMSIGGNGADAITLSVNSCSPVIAGLFEGQGNPLIATANVTVDFSISMSEGGFYSDASCATPVGTAQLIISSGQQFSSTAMYFKPTATGLHAIGVSATAASPMPQSIQKLDIQ